VARRADNGREDVISVMVVSGDVRALGLADLDIVEDAGRRVRTKSGRASRWGSWGMESGSA